MYFFQSDTAINKYIEYIYTKIYLYKKFVFFSTEKINVLISYNINPLNAELNPICHLLALLGSATIVVVSSLRVKLFCIQMLI